MEIVGNVKTYEWGKLGLKSVVAQLASANDKEFYVESETPYSELWMGAHPSGPSTVKSNGKLLSSVIKAPLPFLFKVLSIRKALSIQVHPNKALAEKLHAERPEIYKDSNHKPELAIALTPFMALCGFRPIFELNNFFAELQPLTNLIGKENTEKLEIEDDNPEALKSCYEKLMSSSESNVKKCIKDLSTNYVSVLKKHNIEDVFMTTNQDFPNDVGVLSIFFLNVLRLEPGQAIFLGANEIHAYLQGECIECMACSDNVIRAGLTPKYKDVSQLIACLNYEGVPAHKKTFMPYRIDEFVQVFAPPVDDFAVTQISLPPSLPYYKLQIQPNDAILLTLQGTRKLCININNQKSEILLARGSIVYISPHSAPELELLSIQDCDESFSAFMATYNSFRET